MISFDSVSLFWVEFGIEGPGLAADVSGRSHAGKDHPMLEEDADLESIGAH